MASFSSSGACASDSIIADRLGRELEEELVVAAIAPLEEALAAMPDKVAKCATPIDQLRADAIQELLDRLPNTFQIPLSQDSLRRTLPAVAALERRSYEVAQETVQRYRKRVHKAGHHCDDV